MKTEFLYRFIPAPGENPDYRSRLRDLIQKNHVKLSVPSRLNDPFDCKTLFSTADATIEHLREFVDSTIVRYGGSQGRSLSDYAISVAASDPAKWIEQLRYRYMQAHMNELDKMGILCLFQSKNDADPTDILMWSHYADGHRGFCFQFRRTVLTERYICKRVRYCDRYPTLKEVASCEGESLAELFLFRKATRWVYESEWRILVPFAQTQEGVLSLPSDALTGIILGCNSEPSDQQNILTWSCERDGEPLAIRHAQKHREKYEIVVNDEEKQPISTGLS